MQLQTFTRSSSKRLNVIPDNDWTAYHTAAKHASPFAYLCNSPKNNQVFHPRSWHKNSTPSIRTSALKNSLVNWEEMGLAQKIMRGSFSPDKDIGDLIRTNSRYFVRLATLGSNEEFGLTEILDKVGDKIAKGHTDEEELALFAHVADVLHDVMEKHVFNVPEYAAGLVSACYQPSVYETYKNTGDPITNGERRKFLFDFKGGKDASLFNDLKSAAAEYLLTCYQAGKLVPVQSLHLTEALQTLKRVPINMIQELSHEAHCSMYHTLPANLQKAAAHSSTSTRLKNVYNPFFALDKNLNTTGGPLPWEASTLEQAFKLLSKKSRGKQ